tara:strand:+ start:46 stop:558 length:513 start_codon:yes stop_codon:yes gene_type:complete
MNFNNPEEITTYVKAATNVIMGVDDVVRAFKDMPRRPAFQKFMNEKLGVEDTLSEYEKEVQKALNPEPPKEEGEKTEEEKTSESMIGEAVQETSAPVTRLQVVPYNEGGQRYEVGMNIQQENQIESPESYRRKGFEPTLDERGNIIGLSGPQGSKFKVTRAGEIIPVGPF